MDFSVFELKPWYKRFKAKVLALGLGVLLVWLSWYGWYRYNLLAVNPSNDRALAFAVIPGQSAAEVAQTLRNEGLIKSPSAFLTYITLHGLRFKIQAGEYSLSPAKPANVIAGILAKGQVDKNRLVIPEGSTNRKIIQLAASQGIDEGQMRAALGREYNYEFLRQRPDGIDLEGYLFPDSYLLPSKPDAAKLVNDMLANFAQRLTPDIVAALKAEGLNLHQGLTLASIVEKEVPTAADRAIVAGVFLNRLRLGMPLESDVTVHYAADQLGVPFNLQLDSLYNTYKHPGLPIGPICNPGLSAILATAHSRSTDYLYFLAGKDGKTHYAKTFAEHQRNIQLYLR